MSILIKSAFLAFVLLLSDIFQIEAPSTRGYFFSLFFNYLFYLSLSWFCEILILGIKKINRGIGLVTDGLLHTIVFFYSCSSIYLIKTFDLRWNSLTFQILRETNGDESMGFIKAYILTMPTLILLIIFISLAFLEWRVCSLKRQRDLNLLWATVISVVSLSCLIELRYFSSDIDGNYYNSDKFIKRSSLWKLNQAYLQYNTYLASFDRCAVAQTNLQIDSVKAASPLIVVVIGETFIKRHSSLYGYPLDTNPCLSKETGLITFSNVISPVNATTLSFQYFMSMARTDDTLQWYNSPLFPAFFKQSGYNVVFFSNQYVQQGEVGFYDASAGFLNHPKIHNNLFDNRNHTRYEFDDDLISAYESHRDEIEGTGKSFIMFHLLGQHSPAVERYPQTYSYFDANDIDRKDLSREKRQEIAEYDNAVRYNDMVVEHIINLYRQKDCILIYFADHGEEVYDCRDYAGRKFDLSSGKEIARCQLDVPFLVWTSESYRKNHEDVVRKLEESRAKPMMLDVLPHFLLYLGGISTKWYMPKYNILDDTYEVSRKRILSNRLDYDEL